ncbi:MAG: hypothetical protein JNJ73_11855 [Hyphomonadaceae bacterium]|nr:hypothetical protein [Hyphomonadaceae bacterium]
MENTVQLTDSASRDDFFDPNDVKASFDDIYRKEDPRAYFAVLGSLDYSIPDLARPIIRQIASARRRETGRAATMLDLGSSYGINAALFRHPVTFDMLRRRYARQEMMALGSADLRAFDRAYFQSWPRTRAERLIVADVSAPAVTYAVDAGLADEGVAFDFEAGAPTSELERSLAGVDIVFSTGCVGYVSERTFEAVLGCCARRKPWVVNFVLRMFDYAPIAGALARAGLVTEKLRSAVFVQRRFRDEAEAGQTMELLRKRELDPSGLEAEGLLYAELYVSRPEESVRAAPLEELVTVASGRNISFGPRFLAVQRDGRAELAPVRT